MNLHDYHSQPTSETFDLVELNQTHEKLVKVLKEALLLGQIGFITAGKTLFHIKTNQTYKAEDAGNEWNWSQFCARPDLPFPGRTRESRRRTADALIRIYSVFIEKLKLSENTLAPIGWTKLDLIAPICEKTPDKANDWVGKARELTVSDLAAEIKGKDKGAFDSLKCSHLNEYPVYFCPGCGAKSKHPMNKSHNEIDPSWHQKQP